MAAVMALAAGVGPLLAEAIDGSSADYSPLLGLGAAGCLLGGALMISLPHYPEFADAPTDGRA